MSGYFLSCMILRRFSDHHPGPFESAVHPMTELMAGAEKSVPGLAPEAAARLSAFLAWSAHNLDHRLSIGIPRKLTRPAPDGGEIMDRDLKLYPSVSLFQTHYAFHRMRSADDYDRLECASETWNVICIKSRAEDLYHGILPEAYAILECFRDWNCIGRAAESLMARSAAIGHHQVLLTTRNAHAAGLLDAKDNGGAS